MASSWLLPLVVLVLLGSTVVVVRRALLRRVLHRNRPATPARVTRVVVFLVAGSQLLVMQRDRSGRGRTRLEVPKGKLHDGETPLQAARRECFEESGLRPADLVLFTAIHPRQRTPNHPGAEIWQAYWGTVPVGTVVPYTHRVSGDGRDRGRAYHYHLEPLDTVVLDPPLDRSLAALRQTVRAWSLAAHEE